MYEFKGVIGRVDNGFFEMSLQERIKDFERYMSIREFFNNRFNYFERVTFGNGFAPDMTYIKAKIEKDRLAIYPATETIKLSEVKKFLDSGFNVLFMKAKDFKDFKKDYEKEA